MSVAVAELVEQAERLGVSFRVVGDKVRVTVPDTPQAKAVVERLRPHRIEVAGLLRSGPATCGSPHCAGCYDIGDGRRLHPPKCSHDFLEWLMRWEAKRKVQWPDGEGGKT